MKKLNLIILCLALTGTAVLFSIGSCYSQQQDTIHLRKQSLSDHLVTDRPPHALFMELGGTGLALSMNYDTRFSKRVDGLGIRMGLGFSFTKDPAFMLTMDTEKRKIEGLKVSPCAGAPAQKKAGGAAKKKQ